MGDVTVAAGVGFSLSFVPRDSFGNPSFDVGELFSVGVSNVNGVVSRGGDAFPLSGSLTLQLESFVGSFVLHSAGRFSLSIMRNGIGFMSRV